MYTKGIPIKSQLTLILSDETVEQGGHKFLSTLKTPKETSAEDG